MKVICVKQPWAWLIVAGHKDIENRSWHTTHRGPLLIAASLRRPDHDSMADAIRYARDRGVEVPKQLQYGGVIGRVNVITCVKRHESRWFMGPVGWVLRDAIELPFIPITGQLQIFDAPRDLFPVDDSEGPLL